MGSGKTTYGRQLADALKYNFLDLDEAIEKKAGTTIARLFEEKGEEHFRKLESVVLRETEKLENTVIATGGGTPIFGDNLEWMNTQGKTIYLKVFETELYHRLVDQIEQRPLLKNIAEDELQTFIYETLRKRAYFYHRTQIVIDPMQLSAAELAEIIGEKQAA